MTNAFQFVDLPGTLTALPAHNTAASSGLTSLQLHLLDHGDDALKLTPRSLHSVHDRVYRRELPLLLYHRGYGIFLGQGVRSCAARPDEEAGMPAVARWHFHAAGR
jgi:hypothetical protein